MKKLICIVTFVVLTVVFYSCKRDNVKPSSNHVALKLTTSGDSTHLSGGQNPPVDK